MVEYGASGVTRIWQRALDSGNDDAGTGAALLDLNPGSSNGNEAVLLGGGTSSTSPSTATDEWLLVLYKISALDGSTTQINIKYENGGYFDDQNKYNYFSHFE